MPRISHAPCSTPCRLLGAWLLAWCCLWAQAGRAQEVMAVLSSDLAPYREAYQGFATALGRPVSLVNLQTGRPRMGRDTRVVVAFGGKAAAADYPQDLALVYCVAPATALDRGQRQGSTIKIHMLPADDQVVGTLKELQPRLRHLAALCVADQSLGFISQMQQSGRSHGIEVAPEQLRDPGELPESLRRLASMGIEALWLPPDPLLINANSFALLREFSRANKIPLYAPTAGFAEEGAAAAVGVSFAQSGQAAAEAALAVLAGKEVPADIFPQQYEITVNLSTAAAVELRFSQEILGRAHRIIP